MIPVKILALAETHNERRRHGEHARQCRGLSIRRQQKRQCRHDEDAKSKASRPLDEAGQDA